MSTILSLEAFYVLAGLIVLGVSVAVARDAHHPTRWTSAAFWFLFGLLFLAGKQFGNATAGYLVLAMVALAATNRVRKSDAAETPPEERVASATRLGNWIFLPAILIPVLVIVLYLALEKGGLGAMIGVTKNLTLVALCLATVIALGVALRITGASLISPMQEGSRLLQSVGWALVLPQLLAALGGIFAKAGAGEVVAGLVARGLPTQFPFVAVLAYCLAMAVFTIAMGNAFAAFAVITSGIGIPFIVQMHGGNPAIMAALGMLAGYCGTLCTPMAANFNLVPAMLLDLDDKYAVIKAQLPIAGAVFVFNLLMMWALVYRF